MHTVEFTLREDHSVLSPVFGDSELRQIAFDHPNVALSIWLAGAGSMVTIVCDDARWMAFESNHVQNVIEAVYIFPNLASATLPHGFRLPEMVSLAPTLKVLRLEPITGGDLVCFCRAIQIKA